MSDLSTPAKIVLDAIVDGESFTNAVTASAVREAIATLDALRARIATLDARIAHLEGRVKAGEGLLGEWRDCARPVDFLGSTPESLVARTDAHLAGGEVAGRLLASIDALQARLAAAEGLLARSRTYVDDAATASDDADTSYYASLPEVKAPAIALLADIDAHLRAAHPAPSCLAPMTPEQRAAFKPLTGAEIDAALSEGKRNADAVRTAYGGLPGAFSVPAPKPAQGGEVADGR